MSPFIITTTVISLHIIQCLSATTMRRNSSTTPMPSVTTTPMPSVTTTPMPSVTTTPMPSVTTTPMPSVTTTPMPSVTTTPMPSVNTTPMPSVTTTTCTESDTTNSTSQTTMMIIVSLTMVMLGCILTILVMRLAICLRRCTLVIERPPEHPEPSQLPGPTRTRPIPPPMLPPKRDAPSLITDSQLKIHIKQFNLTMEQRNYRLEQPTVHKNLHSNYATRISRTIHSEPQPTKVLGPNMDHHRQDSTDSLQSPNQSIDYNYDWSQDSDVFPSPLFNNARSPISNTDHETFPFISEDETNSPPPRRIGSYIEPEDIFPLRLALFRAEMAKERREKVIKDKERQAEAISRMKQEELKKKRRNRF